MGAILTHHTNHKKQTGKRHKTHKKHTFGNFIYPQVLSASPSIPAAPRTAEPCGEDHNIKEIEKTHKTHHKKNARFIGFT